MSVNQEGNPNTGITTIVCNHPSSVITDDRIYEYIHRDYFVDPKTQERNTTWWEKDISKWDKLKKMVSYEILDYLKPVWLWSLENKKLSLGKKT